MEPRHKCASTELLISFSCESIGCHRGVGRKELIEKWACSQMFIISSMLLDLNPRSCLTYPLEDPVSLSVTILALMEPSNDSLSVSSVVSSERPLTNNVLLCSVERQYRARLSKATINLSVMQAGVGTNSNNSSCGSGVCFQKEAQNS